MAKKFKVGVLGATGMVGQNYVRLLEGHPWFEVTYVAASSNSAGVTYAEAVKGRWQMVSPIPSKVAKLKVGDVADIESAVKKCDFVFSAFEMPDKKLIQETEEAYARAGLPVVSNASAHRWTEDVPMLIPEINASHTDIIKTQQKNRGFKKGFIAVKPNCSLQSYLTPLYALEEAGYEIKKVILTTMQAVSGAGYPGVPSLDMIDNIVPYIGGEEEKTEEEPKKILGSIKDGKFIKRTTIDISATCTRVPVIDGHTASVSVLFGNKKPTKEQILDIWQKFTSTPQKFKLPFAPLTPIHYTHEDNRPQPRKDRDSDKGMAVTVGRLRECNVFDFKFVALSHNTVRGAAGGGILNAELLVKQGYIK
ncbi:MAG: aspartate-semialdehyde dehydrogenase [Candidatus Paceibacteria bacterium]